MEVAPEPKGDTASHPDPGTPILPALSLALRDWRQTPRSTALGGLLQGTMRVRWLRAMADPAAEEQEEDLTRWEGLTSADQVAEVA
jgi:hypothetical protein